MQSPEATSSTGPATVMVNGLCHRLPQAGDLASLLADLGHPPEAVATAVNGDFVPRHLRSRHLLRDGDRVSCFQPIVGG